MMDSSSAPLRLLFVTARYFPFAGGIQTHVYEVSRRLAQAGLEVTVLTTDPTGALPLAEESEEGVRVQRVRAWPANRDYYLAPALPGFITRGDWDLVHIQGVHTLVPPLAMVAARRASIPYIVSFHTGGHSSPLRNRVRNLQWAVLRPLLVRAARLVAVSNFEAEFFQRTLRAPESKFLVVPNGAQLPEPTAHVSGSPDEPLVVSVGRLERYKGHHRVIQALPALLSHYPDLRLRVVGSGPYEPELRQMVQDLGLSEHVEIGSIPATDREGMVSLLARATLVTLLSDYEAHPISVLEALAMERPVLVTMTSGLQELAERGLAYGIPLESSTEEVVAAMLQQLRQPMRPGKVSLPTWEDCAGDLARLYDSVLRQPQCVS
jgi:glycosyltransferase involved in cell wall biosynthesis